LTPYLSVSDDAAATAFGILPLFVAAFVSFTNMNLAGLGNWSRIRFIGTANYAELFTDQEFWHSLGNTAFFAFIGVPGVIVVSLAVALMLNRGAGRFHRALRAFYFVPAITAIVAISLVWGNLHNTQFGLLNYLLSLINLPPVHWLPADPASQNYRP
jgi:multiple sugar transport system permease protein